MVAPANRKHHRRRAEICLRGSLDQRRRLPVSAPAR